MSFIIKLFVGILFCIMAYGIIEYSHFYYLLIPNIFLTLGVLLFIELLIEFSSYAILKLNTKTKDLIIKTRITFILLFLSELILRFSGIMQTYPEKSDGHYFSGARAEMINSWYWIHQPNDTVINFKKEFEFKRATNSLGLSEKEISKQKKSTNRILALGDSFTEGVGVDYSETWVKKMESHWSDLDVESINAGIGGSDPLYEFALYRDKLKNYESDIIILTINSSDITEVIVRGGFERFKKDGTAGKKAPSWEWIYASSHISRLFLHSLFNFNASLIRNVHSKEKQELAISKIKTAIHKFDVLTKQKNAKFLVVMQPVIQDFMNNNQHKPFIGQTEIQEYMLKEKINFLDTSDDFIQLGNKVKKYFWPIDSHFNEKGYSIFGQSIYKKIEELNWLKQNKAIQQ